MAVSKRKSSHFSPAAKLAFKIGAAVILCVSLVVACASHFRSDGLRENTALSAAFSDEYRGSAFDKLTVNCSSLNFVANTFSIASEDTEVANEVTTSSSCKMYKGMKERFSSYTIERFGDTGYKVFTSGQEIANKFSDSMVESLVSTAEKGSRLIEVKKANLSSWNTAPKS